MNRKTQPPRGPAIRVPVGVWILAAFIVFPELLLTGADLGLWGSAYTRLNAFQYGGFWAGLLDDWLPNYRGQAVVMFVTYGFLHAGLWHLALNVMALLTLAPDLWVRYGARRFFLLYTLSQLGGGLGFGLLGPADVPMIGASGAIFGLAGAFLANGYIRRRRAGLSLQPILRVLLLLLVINLLLWWVLNGQLAWETHLGGFTTGWIFAAIAFRR